jgi:Na+/proline symporter
VVVAFLLLPLYYRLSLTSIYAYLGQRLGPRSHQTGSWFFLLSKMAGAAVKFYVVCIILQRFAFEPLGVPFVVTAVGLVALIWLYTRRGGIKTLVWTDTLQTLCLYVALLIIIYKVIGDLGLSPSEAIRAVADSELSCVFVMDDWVSKQHFVKQFVSGIFIVIVMTGLDQDMMQKNLTCRTLRAAQKDMCTYGVLFLPVNALFLSLGVLLTMWYQQQGIAVPAMGDALLPQYITSAAHSVQSAAVANSSFFILHSSFISIPLHPERY